MFAVNRFSHGGVPGQVLGSITATPALSTANSATHTFSSQSFGAAAANRIIAVAIGATWNAVHNATITGVTIGGVAATQLKSARGASGTTEDSLVEIWAAAVPTGTTGDVVVSLSSAIGANRGVRCVVARLEGASGVTPYSSASDKDDSNTTNALDVSLSTPDGGFVLGAAAALLNSGSATWTGLTEDVDGNSNNHTSTSAHASITTGSALSITVDLTDGGDGQCAVAACWGPT